MIVSDFVLVDSLFKNRPAFTARTVARFIRIAILWNGAHEAKRLIVLDA